MPRDWVYWVERCESNTLHSVGRALSFVVPFNTQLMAPVILHATSTGKATIHKESLNP